MKGSRSHFLRSMASMKRTGRRRCLKKSEASRRHKPMSNALNKQGLVLRHATADDMDRIKPLWEALYRHQMGHGMLLQLPEGAYDAWLKSITPYLGRFASLVVAELHDEIVAFVAVRS